MAEIFLANQRGIKGFEKLVVIKRVLPDLSASDDFVTMFLDEARIAARFDHPNIVRIFDLGEFNGLFYIAMEYIAGEDQASVLQQAKRLKLPVPLEYAADIVIGAAEALSHAHEMEDADGKPMHLVHRDVSPSNIITTWHGSVKLVDFGIARAESNISKTDGGQVKGKIQYLSPEQCRTERADNRSDIFALGICLYELITCKRLFQRDNALQTMSAILKGEVPALDSVRPGVPPELETIMRKALMTDPELRYQTGNEMAADLSVFLSGTGWQRGAKSVEYLTRLFGEDRKRAKLRVARGQRLDEAGYQAMASLPNPEAPRTASGGFDARPGSSPAANRPPTSPSGSHPRPPSQPSGPHHRPPSQPSALIRTPAPPSINPIEMRPGTPRPSTPGRAPNASPSASSANLQVPRSASNPGFPAPGSKSMSSPGFPAPKTASGAGGPMPPAPAAPPPPLAGPAPSKVISINLDPTDDEQQLLEQAAESASDMTDFLKQSVDAKRATAPGYALPEVPSMSAAPSAPRRPTTIPPPAAPVQPPPAYAPLAPQPSPAARPPPSYTSLPSIEPAPAPQQRPSYTSLPAVGASSPAPARLPQPPPQPSPFDLLAAPPPETAKTAADDLYSARAALFGEAKPAPAAPAPAPEPVFAPPAGPEPGPVPAAMPLPRPSKDLSGAAKELAASIKSTSSAPNLQPVAAARPTQKKSSLTPVLLVLGGAAVLGALGFFLFGGAEKAPEPVTTPRPATKPPPEPKLEVGGVRLLGVPTGAKVTIDGTVVANPSGDNFFSTGMHNVVVEAKGFSRFERTIEVTTNQVKEVVVELKKAPVKKVVPAPEKKPELAPDPFAP